MLWLQHYTSFTIYHKKKKKIIIIKMIKYVECPKMNVGLSLRTDTQFLKKRTQIGCRKRKHAKHFAHLGEHHSTVQIKFCASFIT